MGCDKPEEAESKAQQARKGALLAIPLKIKGFTLCTLQNLIVSLSK